MKIVIAGGTGFVGTHLCQVLRRRGDELVVLTRSRARVAAGAPEGVTLHWWDGVKPEGLDLALEGAAAVVNLSGQNVAEGRWTAERKRELADSRIFPTKALVEAMGRIQARPEVFVNASAVGFYGDRDDEELTEESAPGKDFLAKLCVEWEDAARPAADLGVRTVILRLGVVLASHGGAMERMLPPFRLGLGGPLGTGKQWFPWIHRQDVSGMIVYALGNPGVSGAINCVAPGALRNDEFSRTVATVMGRPCLFRVPEFALRLAVGEMADMLLASVRAVPKAALDGGYFFRYSNATEAMREVVGGYGGKAPNQWWPYLHKNA